MTTEGRSAIVLAAAAGISLVALACGTANDPGPPPEELAAADSSSGSVPTVTDAAVATPLCTLAGPPASSAAETLVWSDDFSGTEVDPRKWYAHDQTSARSALQNSFSRSALSVHDGSLHVTASATPSDPEHAYTSGRIDTFGRFARTFGKVEFRAKFPSAPGVWYALWGKPQAAPFPEIDFEVLGKNASQVWMVNHWAGEPLPADERRKYVTAKAVDVTEFHVYSVVWKPSLLEWQIDGQTMMQSTDVGVPTSPVSWTINGWVGGWGATPGTPSVPATFEVDYMRVYRLDGVIAEPTLRVLNPKAQYPAGAEIDLEPANFDEACFHVETYEGTTRLQTVDTWPYRFRPSKLAKGPHSLTFIATDGVRKATTSLDIEIL